MIPYAIDRYSKEAARIYGVLNTRVDQAEWVGGASYSIAHIATYPWIARHDWQGIDLKRFPALRRWYDTIGARPAVQRGMEIPR